MMFAWTSLVSSSDFTGINTDLGTIAAGVVAGCVIIVGIGLVVRAFSH